MHLADGATAADELRREAEANEVAKHVSDAARGDLVQASDGARTVRAPRNGARMVPRMRAESHPTRTLGLRPTTLL